MCLFIYKEEAFGSMIIEKNQVTNHRQRSNNSEHLSNNC